jgi:TRAP-type uncharacterized transport system fused permease subunit
VLVFSLLYYRLSPVTAAFNSIVILMAIMIIEPLTKAVATKSDIRESFIEGFTNIFNGLTGGARNMVAIAIATAAAGIIVGTVTLTGLGLRAVEIVEAISMGSLFLMLGVTAVSCLVLGMGLPTTANYIVMATLTAPVIVALADKSGFEIPLIAVHLFVFYFGILADDTPPVGLAAYAAAGIAGSDPIKTGIQGFFYDMRTAILPFMFIFNTDLLLIGGDSLWYGILVFALAVAGMFAFASATLGFIVRPTNIPERLLLVIVAVFMVNPTLPSRIVELPHAYIYSVTGIIIYGFIIGRQIINAKTEVIIAS